MKILPGLLIAAFAPLCATAQRAEGSSLVTEADQAFVHGDLARAESLYRLAIQKEPKQSGLHKNLANILATENRWTEAESEARLAVNLAPNDPGTLTTLAKLEARFHQSDEAIELFRKVVSVAPKASEAHLNLGIALADARDLNGALTEFSEAVRLAPKSAEAHYNLGRVLVELHRFSEAEAELRRSRALSPKAAETLYLLAVVESQFERHIEASRLLREALAEDPANVDAHYLLGQELEKLGRHSEAISEWKATVELRPDHTGALYALFTGLLQTQPKEAREYQRQFKAAAAQQQAKSLNDRATGLAAQGRHDEAVAAMKESLAACGDCSFRSGLNKNLGLIYAKAGDYENARQQLLQALKLTPNDAEAQAVLDQVEKLTGPDHDK